MTQLTLQDLSILLVGPSIAQSRIIVDSLRRVGVDKIEVAGNGRAAAAAERLSSCRH